MSHLFEDADDELFKRSMRDKHRVLYHLFPDRKTELKYDSKACRRELTLIRKD